MNGKAFLDTNVVIYLYTEDEAGKREAALAVVDKHNCIVSTQVLNEASNIWYKKCGWNGAQISRYLDGIEAVCDEIMIIQRKTINKALNLKDKYGYSYYDCLMLAAALEGNCDTIFTEDMSDGQIIEDQLKIVNPFK